MQKVEISSPQLADLKSAGRWNPTHWLIRALLFLLWFILCRQLSGEWSINEQYNYGWFVPFFAAYLFWLRWEQRPRRESPKAKVEGKKWAIAAAIGALVILFPLRLFEVANPDWRPLGWIHAFAVITITLGVIYLAGGWARTKHFSFPILFFLVAVPWVTPIEAPIVQGLMHGIAAIDSELLNLIGIPAKLEGSLIRISTGLVGVNEACSGVRSLQTSLMIALLFGELNRLTPWRRVLLVCGALLLALIANTIRAFFLVWLAATNGMSVMEKGHDIAGYGILAIVFFGSLGLAHWLGKVEKPDRRPLTSDLRPPTASPFPLSNLIHSLPLVHPSGSVDVARVPAAPFYFLLCLAWLFAIEASVESWYRLHESDLIRSAQWTVAWPEAAPAFHKLEIDEGVRSTLRYDKGGGATWQSKSEISGNPSGQAPLHSLLYFFRWESGHSSVLRARAHRPDICLPNTGWKQTVDNGVRDYDTDARLALPFRHFEFEQTSGRTAFAHAFFCIWQDRVSRSSGSRGAGEAVAGSPGGWMMFSEKLRAVREGERELGQQVIELILTSTQKIEPAEAERIFTDQIKTAVTK